MKTNYSFSRGLLKGLAAVALALSFNVSATAQDAPRKTWDFTKGWSAETVANLEADTDWALHDTEFAYKSPKGMEGALTVKDRTTGETINIPEFDGLKFLKGSKPESYSIRFYTLKTYNSTDKTGQDDPHFRLTVKDEGFTIPGLTAGQTITVYAVSCQPDQTDNGRGIYCKDSYVEFVASESTGTPNATNNGCTFNGIKDITTIPSNYYAVTWKVKDDAEGPVDVTILAGPTTAGVSINKILVDGGDEAGGEADKNILVITPDPANDPIYFAIQDGFVTDWVKSLDEIEDGKTLSDFDAILISNMQKDDKDGELRKALAFYPIVNLSADLVKAWELGTVAESETGTITVAEADLNNALYSDITIEDGLLELVAKGALPVVTPGDYLAKDAVLATVGDKAYILQHNPGRNTHILIPLAEGTDTENENIMGLVRNALKIAAKSKRVVSATTKPSFSAAQGNLETTVTITAAGPVFYTLGADSDPLQDGGVAYTEPIKFTEPTMIKAYATQDGYLASEVASYEVAIAAQATTPDITVTFGDKSATITITTNEEGVDLYYYFEGQASAVNKNELTHIAKYEEAVTVTEPTTVYAFAAGKDVIASEVAKMNVSIPGVDASNIRLDKISSFTAIGISAEKPGGWASGTQYAGKNKETGAYGFGSNKEVEAWSHYTSEKLEDAVLEQAKNEDGTLKFDDNNEPVMVEVKPAVYKVDPNARAEWKCAEEPDWVVVTEGTLLVFETGLTTESQVTMKNDGHDCVSGKHSGYSSAADLLVGVASKGALGHKGSTKSNDKQDPNTGRIESTKAFPLPFDIVLNVKNGNSSGASNVLVSTSDDGQTWSEPTTVNAGDIQRQIRRTRLSIEGEGNKYVRVAFGTGSPQVHDILIYNNGEVSKKYTGIEDVIATEGAEVIAVEYYNLNGVRIAEPAEGFFIKRATLSNGKVVVEKIVK